MNGISRKPARTVAGYLAGVWPEAGLSMWVVCGSFSGRFKPGSRSLAQRKPVRTIEVALARAFGPEIGHQNVKRKRKTQTPFAFLYSMP